MPFRRQEGLLLCALACRVVCWVQSSGITPVLDFLVQGAVACCLVEVSGITQSGPVLKGQSCRTLTLLFPVA